MGCRRVAAKGELLRLVRSGEQVVPDPEVRLEGRGAYLCRTPGCADRALDRKALSRAFRAHVTIPKPTIEFIREWQRSESTR